jgi:flagellar biosynthesis/type III secretory pathway chaperone
MTQKMMKEEITKWTISAQEVLGRMTETKDRLVKDLNYNQKLWNDLLHDKEWNKEKMELSCQYIKAINSLIDTINKINGIKIAPDEQKK